MDRYLARHNLLRRKCLAFAMSRICTRVIEATVHARDEECHIYEANSQLFAAGDYKGLISKKRRELIKT